MLINIPGLVDNEGSQPSANRSIFSYIWLPRQLEDVVSTSVDVNAYKKRCWWPIPSQTYLVGSGAKR